jgi:hypothetical protein
MDADRQDPPELLPQMLSLLAEGYDVVIAGRPKYSILKMLRFAWTGITSFSALPLRLSVFFGFFGFFVAACGAGFGICAFLPSAF